MRLEPHSRLAIAGLSWLALFAVLYALGDALGLWPAPPEGGLHDTDLYAGLAFGIVLLAVLLARRGGRVG